VFSNYLQQLFEPQIIQKGIEITSMQLKSELELTIRPKPKIDAYPKGFLFESIHHRKLSEP